MPKIVIINNCAEQMIGGDMSEAYQLFAALASWRNAWHARAGDVLVVAMPIKDDFLAYLGRTMGFDPATVTVITTHGEAGGSTLDDTRLLGDDMVGRLKAAIGDGQGWRIDPCYHTDGIAELALRLGLPDSTGRRFAAQGGADMLNRKSQFRRFAVGAHLPLAEGSVVESQAALARALRTHLADWPTVIVKKDNGAGGAGNVTVTRNAVTPLPGTRETLSANQDLGELAARLWGELIDGWNHSLVVERYHTARHKFYFEYHIEDDGNIRFLNSGSILSKAGADPAAKELVWVGLQVPCDLPPYATAEAASHAMRMALLAADFGYRGPINIDAILTEEGRIVFNEVNGRWGGGSNVHGVAQRLLGERFADTHVVSTRRGVKTPALTVLLKMLGDRGLAFDPATREGVVVLAPDEFLTHTSELMLLARDTARIAELDAALEATLADRCAYE